MANITEAEKIAHYWAKQTATAISWTGGLTFLVALAALIFNVWVHFSDNDKEEKRRRRADALDRERCRKNDVIDEERRQRRDEEDMERRRRKERGEAEREEALEAKIQKLRYVRFDVESFLFHSALRLSRDPIGANLLSRFTHDFCWNEELADLKTFQAKITSTWFASSLPR